jgi:CspA family cold shock protein
MTDQTRLQGVVKWFDANKGYGFIVRDDRQDDVFVHITDVRRSKIAPEDFGQDDKVTFALGTGDRGVKAVDIAKV